MKILEVLLYPKLLKDYLELYKAMDKLKVNKESQVLYSIIHSITLGNIKDEKITGKELLQYSNKAIEALEEVKPSEEIKKGLQKLLENPEFRKKALYNYYKIIIPEKNKTMVSYWEIIKEKKFSIKDIC